MDLLDVVCEVCGGEFKSKPEIPSRPLRRVCSPKCRGILRWKGKNREHNWSKLSVNCSECGKSIMRRTFNPNKDYTLIKHHFCNNMCKSLWQKRAKPVTEEWLRQKYLNEKLDCADISRIVGRDIKNVWNWLKDFGIPTRARGTSPKVLFKKGEPSAFKGHKQKRGAESPHWKGGITAERQSFYVSDAWKSVVQLAYGRANACCERCGEGRKNRKLHVHHICPFEVKEWRAFIDNLAVLCRPCHLFVHSNENVGLEFIAVPINTRRIKRGRPARA